MGSTHHTSGRRLRRTGATAAAAAVIALAGCSGGGGDDATSAPAASRQSSADAAASEAGGAAATVAPAPVAVAGAPNAPSSAGDPASAPAVGQALAVTAHATLRSDDVRVAVDRLTATVATHGGRVASADVHYAPDPDDEHGAGSRATLVLAVPPDQLAAVRAALDDAGEVLAFEQQADDVAKQLTDLDSRITNQRASIARIRELYAGATDVEAIVRIEAELTSRETTLEELLASKAALDDRVAMATLTVDVTPSPTAATAPADDDDPGLADALAGGWRAFAGALFAVVLVLTAAMPFVLTVLVVGVMGLTVVRRLRRQPEPPRREEPAVTDEAAVASRPG